MSYKLIKKFYKKNDEVWAGVFIGDISKAINTKTPDDRDKNGYSDAEKQQFFLQLERLKVQPGYLGFDRSYVNDNQLDLIRYFDTEENMRAYYNKDAEYIGTINKNSKFLGYMIRYEMQDADGNTLEFLTRDGNSTTKTETILFVEEKDV
jgi:hypothetical protein